MSSQKAPINKKQISIIKMAQNQLCIDDAAYRALLANECNGASSCTQISYLQANRLIDIFQEMGFKFIPKKQGWQSVGSRRGSAPSKRPKNAGANVVRIASQSELAKLEAVAALISWRAENGLQLFLAKRLQIKDGRVRTAQEAYLAIEALKKMFENGIAKQHGPDWWSMPFEDARVMEYIRIHKPEKYK